MGSCTFIARHRCAKVEVLEVGCHIPRIRCGDGAVNEQFGSSEVGSFGADIVGIIDAIAAGSPADAARVGFLGTHGGDDAKIRCFATLRNVLDVDEKESVGALERWHRTPALGGQFCWRLSFATGALRYCG